MYKYIYVCVILTNDIPESHNVICVNMFMIQGKGIYSEYFNKLTGYSSYKTIYKKFGRKQ